MGNKKLLSEFLKGHPLIWSFILIVILTVGCSNKGEKIVSKSVRDDSPVLAEVGSSKITQAEFKSYISNNSGFHRVSKERMEQWLNERVLEEVLYQEAVSKGMLQDPGIQRDIRQMLTSKLLDDYMRQEVWEKEIEEAEIKKYYDDHWKEFNRPDQIRIADIFIYVPEDASEEMHAEMKDKAMIVLDKALKSRKTRSGFGMLIKEYSDTPLNYRKGDTGFFNDHGQPIDLDRAIVDAAFAIERVGSISEQLIETADGYHIIMLTGKRSGVHIPLDNVRQKITQWIRRDKAATAKASYIESLKAESDIEVHDSRLSAFYDGMSKKERTIGRKIVSPGNGNNGPPALPGK